MAQSFPSIVVKSLEGATSTQTLYTVGTGVNLVITSAWVSEGAGTLATIQISALLAADSTAVFPFDIVGVAGVGSNNITGFSIIVPAAATVKLFMSGAGPASGGFIGYLAEYSTKGFPVAGLPPGDQAAIPSGPTVTG